MRCESSRHHSAGTSDVSYDSRHFLDAGIDHVEVFFEDGSNPSDEIVRAFIDLAEHWIRDRGLRVAVHCKAGLGRTGVLIGGKSHSKGVASESDQQPT